jgi:hypothetical protein
MAWFSNGFGFDSRDGLIICDVSSGSDWHMNRH